MRVGRGARRGWEDNTRGCMGCGVSAWVERIAREGQRGSGREHVVCRTAVACRASNASPRCSLLVDHSRVNSFLSFNSRHDKRQLTKHRMARANVTAAAAHAHATPPQEAAPSHRTSHGERIQVTIKVTAVPPPGYPSPWHPAARPTRFVARLQLASTLEFVPALRLLALEPLLFPFASDLPAVRRPAGPAKGVTEAEERPQRAVVGWCYARICV